MSNAMILTPILFDATSKNIRLTQGIVTETVSLTGLTVGRNYWLSGDGQADTDGGVGGIGDLLPLIKTALDSHTGVGTYTVTLTTAFRVRIVLSSDVYQVHWADALTTLNPEIVGFAKATIPTPPADDSTGGFLPQNIWRANRAVARDGRNRQPIVGGIARAISGLQRISSLALPLKERDIDFRFLLQRYVLEEYEDSTEPFGSFEYAWINSMRLGRAFRLYEDETVRTASSYTLYRTRSLEDPLTRNSDFRNYWDCRLEMVRV